jgi:hypothetical protein
VKPLICLVGHAAIAGAALAASPAHAQNSAALSGRLQAWTSDRLASTEKGIGNAEVWGRAHVEIGAFAIVRGEAWAARDPRGTGDADVDIREGLIELDAGPVKLRAGRQLYAWGRADRVNPTDVLAPRDLSRLVVEDEENRAGQLAVSVGVPLAEGTLAAHWVPEFRPTTLPQDLAARGLPLVRDTSDGAASYALRYERFGGAVDFALTASEGPDRVPWLAIGRADGGGATLALTHPRLRMIGADVATTLGNFGVRVETASYFQSNTALRGLTARRPTFAATLGVDRSLRGQWLVIGQAILRRSAGVGPLDPSQSALAETNAVIHGAWRKTIVGATLLVRKTLAENRGTAEVTGVILSGGGASLQARASITITDNLRVQLLGEHFDGPAGSFFGIQSPNSNLMIGLRAGF